MIETKPNKHVGRKLGCTVGRLLLEDARSILTCDLGRLVLKDCDCDQTVLTIQWFFEGTKELLGSIPN